MRAFPLVAVALVIPLAGLSGCSGTQDLSLTGLFAIPAFTAHDPMPLPAPDCDALVEDLKGRLLLETRVALDRSLADRLDMGQRRTVPPQVGIADDMSVTRTGAPMAARASSESSGASHTHSLHDSSGAAMTTGTNNQEAGVDEGDLVKTDGHWTYILSQGTLHIIRTPSLGELDERATLQLGSGGNGELLLLPRGPGEQDDRLVAILNGQATTPASETGRGSVSRGVPRSPAESDPMQEELRPWHGASTRIVVIGLADRSRPTVEKDLMVEGTAAASRLVGDHVYVVVATPEQRFNLQRHVSYSKEDLAAAGLSDAVFQRLGASQHAGVYRHAATRLDEQNEQRIRGAELSDFMPVVREGGRGRESGGLLPAAGEDCDRVLATPGGVGRGITTIAAIAAGDDEAPTELRQVVGSASIVYAAPTALVMAAPTQDLWFLAAQAEVEVEVQATTDITWFTLDGLAVDALASGRVVGLLQDQFSLDVKGTELRVASTIGAIADLQSWMGARATGSIATQVATFSAASGQLVPTGLLTGIAPGERIWSARFTDDRAYLVTFPDPVEVILTDPLWVIDLAGPLPKVLGELEIPGVSTYIHPLSDDALLSIGYGPGPNDNGLDRNRIQVSLFDISDTSRPRRTSVLDLSPEEGRSWSGAVAEHKAFSYWADAGLLAIPVTTNRDVLQDGEHRMEQHVGLTLVDVDQEAMQLKIRGTLEQEGLLEEGEVRWGAQVLRSYFQGFAPVGIGSVVSISDMGVTAHDIRDLRQQDAVAFAP